MHEMWLFELKYAIFQYVNSVNFLKSIFLKSLTIHAANRLIEPFGLYLSNLACLQQFGKNANANKNRPSRAMQQVLIDLAKVWTIYAQVSKCFKILRASVLKI